MSTEHDSLPLAVLDFVGIEYGEGASDSLVGAVSIAQAIEAAGYRRYWVSSITTCIASRVARPSC